MNKNNLNKKITRRAYIRANAVKIITQRQNKGWRKQTGKKRRKAGGYLFISKIKNLLINQTNAPELRKANRPKRANGSQRGRGSVARRYGFGGVVCEF